VIVSELSANAVRHTDGPARLTIIRGDRYLHLVVNDSDPHPPTVAGGPWDVTAEGGRGLRLVESLAASWGTSAASSGKAVWATLSLAPGASATHRPG